MCFPDCDQRACYPVLLSCSKEVSMLQPAIQSTTVDPTLEHRATGTSSRYFYSALDREYVAW